MKKDIQPNYVEVTFVCACGSEFTGKTSKVGVKAGDKVKLEVCDKCHPFYNGTKDNAGASKTGRVEKFNRKYGLNQDKAE